MTPPTKAMLNEEALADFIYGVQNYTDAQKAAAVLWQLLSQNGERERVIEECIRAGEKAWPHAHTYASENADLYIAQDRAVKRVIDAIRALKSGEKGS